MKGICILIFVAMNSVASGEPLPEPVKQIVDRAEFGANNELRLAPSAERVLADFCRTRWRSFLPELSAPEFPAKQRDILIQAAVQGLPDAEYLSFVTDVFRYIADGRFPVSVADRIVYPTGEKDGFLALNYDDPELARALRAALPALSTTPEAKAYVEEMLSGAAKEDQLRAWRNQSLPPQRLPVAQQPSPSATAQEPRASTPVGSPTLSSRASSETSETPPASTLPTGSAAESPKTSVEARKPVWPWLIGIAALIGVVLLVLKRRV